MPLVSASEFAESLGRSRRSISDAVYRGSDIPPSIKIGGRRYFAQEDIDEWIDGKRLESRADMEERQIAIERATGSATSQGSTRPPTRRERPASYGKGRSLSDTASLKGVSDE